MPIFLLSFFLFHYTADDDNKDKVEVSRDFKENVIEPILKVIREEILECIYCVTIKSLIWLCLYPHSKETCAYK